MLGEPIKAAAKRSAGLSNSAAGGPAWTIFPSLHQHDAVGQRHGLPLVMCDVNRGDAKLLLELPQLPTHLFAILLLHPRQRLVKQEHVRFTNDGPRKRNLLSRSGRQPDDVSVEDVTDGEDLGDPIDLFGDLRLCATPRARKGNAMFWRTVRCG